MRKEIGKWLAAIVLCVLISGLFTPAMSVSAARLQTDVSEPSDGCVMIGINGSYLGGSTKALERINEIRKEACREGVINPATGQKLTPSDYVPIQWSSDLEYIARIRAAEATLTMDHVRTNNASCFYLSAPNGMKSWGEVLAWNWSKSMVYGVNQWYGEKRDWVNQNQNAVTGHYTAMIDPNNRFVGLAAFYSKQSSYPNSVAGEFMSERGVEFVGFSPEELSRKKASPVSDCTQMLELSASYVNGIRTPGNVKAGKASRVYAVVGKRLYPLYKGTWTSSDPSVLSVDKYGRITPKKAGKSTVSVNYGDIEYRVAIKVTK